MFGLGWPEVVVITIVGVAIFGAKRIPEIGRSVGQALRGFKDEIKSDSREDIDQPNVASNVKEVKD